MNPWLQLPLWAAEEPLVRKLDPVLRAQVLMTLLGLLLLGLCLIVMVLMGGRYVRRLARHRAGGTGEPKDEWFRKPLVKPSDPADDEP